MSYTCNYDDRKEKEKKRQTTVIMCIVLLCVFILFITGQAALTNHLKLGTQHKTSTPEDLLKAFADAVECKVEKTKAISVCPDSQVICSYWYIPPGKILRL